VKAAVLAAALAAATPPPQPTPAPPAPPAATSPAAWRFAVSGDSRDCGDCVVPKIAASLAGLSKTPPLEFYWHLGDFRNGRIVDRDFLVLNDGDEDYHRRAWDDFLTRQIAPLEKVTKVFLGIGNHELIYPWWGHEEYREKFGRFLMQEPIQTQRVRDRTAGLVLDRHHVDYHFPMNGVDFVYLDNSDSYAFTPSYLVHPAFTDEQLVWLRGVLKEDLEDDTIKAVVVGMHAALPSSTGSAHAMDDTCHGRASGGQVYEMLWELSQKKHVYVLASHAHDFEEDVFAKADGGKVLPGWIIGTAGAVQRRTPIRYGYVLFEVAEDRSMTAKFVEVNKDDPPVASTRAEREIRDWCWSKNLEPESRPRRVNCGSPRRR
jgi:hypothetical protein